MKKVLVLLMGTLLLTGIAVAQDRPSAEEARKVIDYYYNGQGQGVVLMDYLLCQEISTEGPDKNDCKSDLNPGQLTVGQEAYLWMNYIVPVQDKAELIILFSRKGKVRKSTSVTLSGATRFRTWKKVPTNKPGQYTVSIIQELDDRDLDLGSFQYNVAESMQ